MKTYAYFSNFHPIDGILLKSMYYEKKIHEHVERTRQTLRCDE